MHVRTKCARILWGILALCCTLVTPGPARADLRISEVLSSPASDWNGDGTVDFKSDEWVEIENIGPNVENLDGVYLRDGTGDAYHFGFSGSLAPGDVILVLGSDAVAWQAANGAGSSGLSLNNSGDRLELWRDLDSPRVLEVLDAIDIPAHAAVAERSYALDPVSLTMVLFDALAPYTGTLDPQGTGCAPSPGVANVCDSVVPTVEASVGDVKRDYRP